jgi:hypothetical protein
MILLVAKIFLLVIVFGWLNEKLLTKPKSTKR